MRNWDSNYEAGFCSDEKDFEDATFVCRKLEIPLRRVYFIKEYWNEVFTVLLKEYETGLTPNPDILCNRYIKFDRFFEYCRSTLGTNAIATGHYANTSFGPLLEKYNESEGMNNMLHLLNYILYLLLTSYWSRFRLLLLPRPCVDVNYIKKIKIKEA